MILKGHLLVEEILRDIVEKQLAYPEALKGRNGASFDCHQIICLAEAMTPKGQKTPWLWVAVKKLNSLRNKLAHQLNEEGLLHKVDDFNRYVFKHSDIDLRSLSDEKGLSKEMDIVMSIIGINASLPALLGATSSNT